MSEGGRDTELVPVVLVLAPFALALVATWLVPGTPKELASGWKRWLPVTWWVSKGERWVWGSACAMLVLACASLGAVAAENASKADQAIRRAESQRDPVDWALAQPLDGTASGDPYLDEARRLLEWSKSQPSSVTTHRGGDALDTMIDEALVDSSKPNDGLQPKGDTARVIDEVYRTESDYERVMARVLARLTDESNRCREDLEYLRLLAQAKGVILPTDDELARRHR